MFRSLCMLALLVTLPVAAQTTQPTTVQIDNANSTSQPDDTQIPEANPARPTFTNPAHIPPVGYLQFEQGSVQANTSPSVGHQFSAGQSLRLAVHPRLMLQFQSQPFASTTTPGGPTRDTGDLDAGVQGLLTMEKGNKPTVALAYLRRVRAGTAPDLDMGGFSQSAVLLISGDLGQAHYDTNIILNEQTNTNAAGDPIRRAQYGQTVSVTHEIFPVLTHKKVDASGELWHFTQPLVSVDAHNRPSTHSNAGGVLVALTYAPIPNLVLDLAVDHGLTRTSTQWQALGGLTYLLPHRLWPNHSGAPAPERHHQNTHHR